MPHPRISRLRSQPTRDRCASTACRAAGSSPNPASPRSSARLNSVDNTSPNTAIASSPAIRDTALFTPEATPASLTTGTRLHHPQSSRRSHHADRHPKPQHHDRGKEIQPVRASNPRPQKQTKSRRRHQRPHRQRCSRSIPRHQPAGPPRQHKHQQDQRQQRRPRLRRRVALHLDQIHRKEKQNPAHRRIQKKRQQVRPREIPRTKQPQRNHRRSRPRLHHQKRRQRAYPHRTPNPRTPAPARPLDQRIRHRTQPHRRQRRTPSIEPLSTPGLVAALRHPPPTITSTATTASGRFRKTPIATTNAAPATHPAADPPTS